QLETDGEPRALEALLAQLAVAEVELRQLHAADRQALELPWLVALADDQLGAAAADVDHEIAAFAAVDVVRDAEIDQPRFLHAGDHLDRMAERLLGGGEERLGVAGAAQRVRPDDADLIRVHAAEALAAPA